MLDREVDPLLPIAHLLTFDDDTTAHPVADKPGGSVQVTEVSGVITHGPARTLSVALRPMEAQILARKL